MAKDLGDPGSAASAIYSRMLAAKIIKGEADRRRLGERGQHVVRQLDRAVEWLEGEVQQLRQRRSEELRSDIADITMMAEGGLSNDND